MIAVLRAAVRVRTPPIVLVALLLAFAPSAANAQEGTRSEQAVAESCPWAGPEPAGVGIERLVCIGGECEINLVAPDGRLEHRFSTEPRIERLRSWASPELREGDVITSVDGEPITTAAGGRALARLTLETTVTLGLRRGPDYVEARLTPRPGCPISSLAVRRPSWTED